VSGPNDDRTDVDLEALAERYRTLLETGPIGVFEVHRDGTIRFANNAVARMAGYPDGRAMVGMNILRHWVEPKERDMLWVEVAERGSVANFPVALEALDGTVRQLLLSVTAFGDVIRGYSVDVTREHVKERELQSALELVRSVLEAMPGGVVHVSADGSIEHANGDACRVLGLSYDQLTRRYTTDFDTETLHEDGSPCSVDHYPVTRALVTGQTQPPHTIGVRRPDGSVSWAVFRAVPVLEPGSNKVTGAVVTFFDITDRKAAEQRLRALEERVRHAQKLESLGMLAGGVAHDFNNLLAAILGNASLAKIQLSPESDAAQSLAALESAAQRAADLTRQMLTYAGRGPVEARQLDVSSFVRELADLLGTVISKKATLDLELETNLPPIEADATQLSQVLMNLILNASDALGDASGTITIRTGRRTMSTEALSLTYVDDELPAGDYLFVEVHDSGSGMDRATLQRVFDPFFTTKSTGRGLGLAATLGIVRSHKGAIELLSAPGAGTTFRIFVPVSDRIEADTPRPQPSDVPRSSARLLVIDDEPAVRDVTRRLLAELGYAVVTADGGRSGIAAYSAQPSRFDVVLLDLTMSDLSGREVMEELVRIDPKVRVVLCSGYAEEDVRDRFESANLVAFLHKPYTTALLVEAVERARRA
jgi:two-component system, cell cycle sensor histidine kinase and response regulator CckA